MTKPKSNTEDNGLVYKRVRSNVPIKGEVGVKDLGDIQTFLKANGFPDGTPPDMAVFYMNYGIRFAKWEQDKLIFYENAVTIEPEFLLEARIFNRSRELRILQLEPGRYYYRTRVENDQGEDADIIEARQCLWGTRSEPLDHGWSRLYEDRGTELIVPLHLEHAEGEDRPLAVLVTRNYIGKLKNGQATYIDCRFVAIESVKLPAQEKNHG